MAEVVESQIYQEWISADVLIDLLLGNFFCLR